MLTEKQLIGSRYLSKLNLNTHAEDITPNTFWCRAARAKNERQNRKEQRHSFFELHLCLDGCCVFAVDGKNIELTANTFILLPPQKRHMLTSVSENFEKLVWGFAPQDEKSAGPLAEVCANVKVCSVPDAWLLSVARILDEGERGIYGSTRLIRGELCYLYVSLVRFFMPKFRQSENTVSKVGIRAQAIREFIADNLSADLQISDIAEQFFISERQLERICMQEYRMTVGALKRNLQAQAIRTLLADTTFSLSEIAKLTGFADRYSMSKFFKKEEGLPPARYRASLVE